MGSNALANKQWVKGLTLMISEIVFIVWFVLSGIPTLNSLATLGTDKTKKLSMMPHKVCISPSNLQTQF